MTVEPARLGHSPFALSLSPALTGVAFGATYPLAESAPPTFYELQDEDDEEIEDDADDEDDEDEDGELQDLDEVDEGDEEDEDEEVEDEA